MNPAVKKYIDDNTAYQTELESNLTDLEGDIQSQADQIAALQNTADTWTPADQAVLDNMQAKNSATLTRVQALNAKTPPAAPQV